MSGVIAGAAAIGAGRLVPGEPWRELLSWLGGVVIAATLAAGALVGALSSPVLSRLRRRGEIYVSPHGIYRRPGGYLPFFYFYFGHSLADVELSDGPPMHVRLLAVTHSTSFRSGERLWATVLVPAGREAEARQLVELIRADLAERRSRPPHEYRAGGSSNWPDNIDLSWLT